MLRCLFVTLAVVLNVHYACGADGIPTNMTTAHADSRITRKAKQKLSAHRHGSRKWSQFRKEYTIITHSPGYRVTPPSPTPGTITKQPPLEPNKNRVR